ncbi:MAG: S8 family serine peptidase [Candidatus Lokiarchaeota archaeon]|nr:S8 family serine peptidase [Candidatus Lokiarchaeota archaeon]
MKSIKRSHQFVLGLSFTILMITAIANTQLYENTIYIGNEFRDPPSSQMNYIKDQLHLDPYIWNTLGFSGDPNASIVIIGSGIDFRHPKFGYDSFGDKDFNKKIIGWKDYVNISNLEPVDPHGLSTFTAISAFGNNDSNSKIYLDSENRTSITLGSKYEQQNLFPTDPGPGWFNIKLGSLCIDQINANITLNATYSEYSTNFIQNASFQIKSGNTVLNQTIEDLHGIYRNLSYTTEIQPAIYDFYFRYYLKFSSPANFSVNAIIKAPLENGTDYSGIAPQTKIIGLRILNEKLEGNVSSLVSALNWAKINRDDYHIIGIQVDLGDYEWDVSATILSDVIESVIESGIMLFLPAGDSGVKTNALNPLVVSEYPIVVGSVSDIGKLTFYTSLGQEISTNHKKIDILAPGGSYLAGHRTIISADTNANDALGYLQDQSINDSTSIISTSISTGFVTAAYSLLVEALGGYMVWESLRTINTTLALKSRLLMTATELNQAREDNPYTTAVDESSTIFSPNIDRGLKDTIEGFGLLNIPAALESILFEIMMDSQVTDHLVSAPINITGLHSFARRIQLNQNEYYNFTLNFSNSSDLDLYIYQNRSDLFGDPILIQKSTSSGNINESIVFGLEQDSGEYILVIKSIDGNLTKFELNVTNLPNLNAPTLTDHSVAGIQGYNDTLDTFEFMINYTDLDNLPPITIDLNITGVFELIPFIKVSMDMNYTDGCLYSARFHFYETGTYHYHIIAWDGINLVRTPELVEYNLTVVPIKNAVYNNYSWFFSSMGDWEKEGYWNNISQSNEIDPRGIMGQNWNALYFGDTDSAYLGKYSYESVPELSVSRAYSPQFWLNASSNPILRLGTRISINQGDFFILNIRLNRTGSWTTIDSFSNSETEWRLLKYDLSAYVSSYVQFQLVVELDLLDDIEYNKGILLSEFTLLQQHPVNINPTLIFNATVTPDEGPIYQNYRFSVIVGDKDGETPDMVYLEIDQINYTMFNIYGDFDSTYELDNGTLESGGIIYAYDIFLAAVRNSTFRIHVVANSYSMTTEFFAGPQLSIHTTSSFPYYGIPSNMSVYGNPQPHPQTIWVSSSNSLHYIARDEVWYFGEKYYFGYGENWNVYMVTSLIRIPRSTEETDRVYLWFEHQLRFDTLFPQLFGDDYAQIMISPDFGSHWYELITYDENVNQYQSQKIDLWNYRGMDVLIRFNFHSDDTSFLPTFQTGWYVRNIMVNVDLSLDKEPPTVIFTNIIPNMEVNETFTIEIYITDPSGVDDSLVTLFINTIIIDDAVSEDGVILYDLDTTKFRNGNTTISVLAYDEVGNKIIETTYIIIKNEGSPMVWIYIIIGVTIALIAGILYFYFQVFVPSQRKKELRQEMLSEEQQRRLMEELRERQVTEMRIREETELATPESEALKSFTYECRRCRKQFQNQDYIWSMICPDCKTDTLNLVYQCKLCGKIYYEDMPGEYFCKDCNIKLLK